MEGFLVEAVAYALDSSDDLILTASAFSKSSLGWVNPAIGLSQVIKPVCHYMFQELDNAGCQTYGSVRSQIASRFLGFEYGMMTASSHDPGHLALLNE